MLTLWFVMSPAYAWQSSGHKMTAEIAFNLLSEIQQQQVAEILSAHPRFKADFARAMPNEIENGPERERNLWLFERAAIWPEIVRHISEAGRTRYDRSSWHYINLPVYLTKQDEAELADKLDHNISGSFKPPLRRNLNMIQALKGNLLVWRDETASDDDKAVAFCWILHLTGDVHQPLHNVALFSRGWFPKGDRGGNLIAIRNDDDVTNLHAVWDGLPRRFKDLAPDEETRELLSNDVARIQSISAWAIHYQEMAQEFVYTEEVRQKILQQVAGKQNPEISLTPEYLAAAVELARPQIIIAGHRIAALIRN
jgi:hypothetical protein